MSEYGTAARRSAGTQSTARTALFTIGAALLIGLGLMGVAYWLVTQSWLDFLGLVPLALGAYLLFTRGTGPDRA